MGTRRPATVVAGITGATEGTRRVCTGGVAVAVVGSGGAFVHVCTPGHGTKLDVRVPRVTVIAAPHVIHVIGAVVEDVLVCIAHVGVPNARPLRVTPRTPSTGVVVHHHTQSAGAVVIERCV